MSSPNDFELLELAAPYALHALSDAERASVDAALAAAPTSVSAAFADEVRAVRETMAVLSSASVVEPPDQLRATVLALTAAAGTTAPVLSVVRQSRWRTAVFAGAAAVAVGLGAFGLGVLTRPAPTQTVAEQILGAPDVRTVSRPLGPGTATVMFSRDRNAAMLVMNNVPPPSPGTVYQMWLIDAAGPTSAGTMGVAAVSPSTKAMLDNLGSSTTLAFTVEPGNGSPKPTGAILAELPLS